MIIYFFGGLIGIEWCESDGYVLMIGLIEVEFEGEVDLDMFYWCKIGVGDVLFCLEVVL